MINLDDGAIGMAAVLSDFSAIYLFYDSSNVNFISIFYPISTKSLISHNKYYNLKLFRGLISKNIHQDKVIFHKCVAINQLFKLIAFGCKK